MDDLNLKYKQPFDSRCYQTTVKRTSVLGPYSGDYKNFWSGLRTYLSTRTKFNFFISLNVKGKGKAVPLQAWSGPEGSRKLRFPDFMTTAQDGGKVVSLTHRPPLPPGNTPGTHFC